jgi:hypothetical protein
VNDATASGGDKISNFSVGGETNNVMLIAPSGSRNIVFGKGMDTVEIRSHVIESLQANRGALNSNVFVDRQISQVQIGGDVVNTNVLAGNSQSYAAIFNAVTGQSSNPLFGTTSPTAPPRPQNAQPFGFMHVHVAGDITNSVFAASVQPFIDTTTTPPTPVFGDPNQLVLTGGQIKAKVEGSIDNSVATPSTPNQAFFAKQLNVLTGPVVPPNVPEPPFTGPQLPAHLPGIHGAKVGSTPKGPLSSSSTKKKP